MKGFYASKERHMAYTGTSVLNLFKFKLILETPEF